MCRDCDGPTRSRQHEAQGRGSGGRGGRGRNGGGLGTGSTAAFAIEVLAARVNKGLRIVAIPTSEKSAVLARRLGVPLTSFAEHRHIDLAIDGADQVEGRALNLVKGLGGALLREKIVASASRRLIIVVDETKLVDRLGLARRCRSRSCGSDGRPCSTDLQRSAARRGCASLTVNRSSQTAATSSPIALLTGSPIQRFWRRSSRQSLASSKAASLSVWHPRSWLADRLAWRYLSE